MPDPTTPDIDAGSFCEPTCCAWTDPSAVTEDEPIRQAVRDGYARIARGEIRDMATVEAHELDALVFPGGFGAAKNLCSFAVHGASMTVNPEVDRLIKNFEKKAGDLVEKKTTEVMEV